MSHGAIMETVLETSLLALVVGMMTPMVPAMAEAAKP
jgi:hypothetical protein